MSEKPSLSVVIPVFNEEPNLDELVRRCVAACGSTGRPFEIILVDDGSADRSAERIEAAALAHPGRVLGVFLNRNYGQHAAVMAGLAQSRGDYVVTIDADLQNPPEEIPKIAARLDEGFEVVGGVRAARHDPLFRRAASTMVNWVVRKATGVHMRDYGCMLRGYRRNVVEAMLQCRENSTFIPVLANAFARSAGEVPVSHEKRLAGDSKYGLWRLINLQFDLLTTVTTFPLRLLGVLGVLVSALGVGFGFFLLIMRLIYGPEWAVGGVFTLFAVLFVFVGLQFIGMGLLGEYIGRIYYDVRGRPRYFVQRYVGQSGLRRAAGPEARREG